MMVFCAAIERNSASLLRFHFCRHVYVFSGEILPYRRLKYSYGCFSSPFCFLVFVAILFFFRLSVLLHASLNSLSLLFLFTLWIFVLIHLRNLQRGIVLFLLLFLKRIVCLYHLSDVRPCTSSSPSSSFLSSDPSVCFPATLILKIILITSQWC